jgi:hypothetical protein
MSGKLVIFGDSWACGAWSTPGDYYAGPPDYYFEKQLSKYFNVENYGEGGTSNVNTIFELLKYVHKVYSSVDLNEIKFLIIQTDPIRDYFLKIGYNEKTKVNTGFNHITNDFYDIFKHASIKQFAEMQIELFYYQLNDIAKHFGVKLNIIGGCSDVHSSIDKYKNLNVLCYSWFKLIDENYKLGIFSDATNIYNILKFNSMDDHHIIDQMNEKIKVINQEQGKLFGYGSDNHPSHAGQDLMINHIINKL